MFKKTIYIFIISLMYLSLTSCSMMPGVIPDGFLSETNNNQDMSTAQNRVDPNMAGNNAYKNSSHDDNSVNLDTGSNSVNFGGEHSSKVSNDLSEITNNDLFYWFLMVVILSITNVVAWVSDTPQTMWAKYRKRKQLKESKKRYF